MPYIISPMWNDVVIWKETPIIRCGASRSCCKHASHWLTVCSFSSVAVFRKKENQYYFTKCKKEKKIKLDKIRYGDEKWVMLIGSSPVWFPDNDVTALRKQWLLREVNCFMVESDQRRRPVTTWNSVIFEQASEDDDVLYTCWCGKYCMMRQTVRPGQKFVYQYFIRILSRKNPAT